MVTIRTFTKEDMEFLKEMLYECIYIPENKPSKESLLNLSHIKKYWVGWGRKGDTALIATDSNHRPLGAVWYRLFDEENKGYGFVDDHTPELSIAVSQAARGLGIGRLLMKKIMEQAMNDGYPALSLSVDGDNSHAIELYRKLGFEDVGVSGTSTTMLKKL